MDKKLISVIIPIYNTARRLPECVESVLGQDYGKLEVILVNDASSDNSLSVCNQYAARDAEALYDSCLVRAHRLHLRRIFMRAAYGVFDIFGLLQ